MDIASICVCGHLGVKKRVQCGVDTSPKANILAATGTFRHNALKTKWQSHDGTFNALRFSQTPKSCLSSIRTVYTLALRMLAKDHTSTGGGVDRIALPPCDAAALPARSTMPLV